MYPDAAGRRRRPYPDAVARPRRPYPDATVPRRRPCLDATAGPGPPPPAALAATRTPGSAPARHLGRLRPGPRAPGSRPQARRSASANCGQVAYRSTGTLASALAITSSTAAGRSGRRLVSAGGGADIWAHITATDSSLVNGGAPVSMVNAVQASAYSSVRASTGRPFDLLRCDVIHGAEELAGGGQRAVGQRALAQPEVRQVGVAGKAGRAVQQDVARLDVPVHQAVRVRRLQPGGHLRDDVAGLHGRQRSPGVDQ